MLYLFLYKISDKSILYKSDSKKENLPRKMAIYLCQKIWDMV